MTCSEKRGRLGFSNSSHLKCAWGNFHFSVFFYSTRKCKIWLHIGMLCLCSCNIMQTIIMGANNCSETYSLVIKILHIFQISNISTCVYNKNSHNSTFFMELAPLDSAHTELSIHAKNSFFMKYPEWSLFSEQVT